MTAPPSGVVLITAANLSRRFPQIPYSQALKIAAVAVEVAEVPIRADEREVIEALRQMERDAA